MAINKPNSPIKENLINDVAKTSTAQSGDL